MNKEEEEETNRKEYEENAFGLWPHQLGCRPALFHFFEIPPAELEQTYGVWSRKTNIPIIFPICPTAWSSEASLTGSSALRPGAGARAKAGGLATGTCALAEAVSSRGGGW